ncbi:hypothetical protein M9H77_23827 [Catharanthus roseus]|uniref:Uncharacterized protein n=1 Tax=Catharanthus roseus TaxID=4058 RepID=A0ACC0AVD8_CATRO|nr:hypothetical protein M9H77_23827 [Catharanthus roseus]
MEEVPAHVHPSPIVPDILTRQHEHRFGLIWSGDLETCFTDLQCRCFGRNIFKCYSTAPRRLVDLIDSTGLEGVFRYGYIGLDHALITALVERWRPETHTFHMTCGEVTITLQDLDPEKWTLLHDGGHRHVCRENGSRANTYVPEICS